MKVIFRIIVILAVIVAVFVVGRNVIVKIAAEKGVQAATGLPLKIKKLDIGLAKTHIGINDLSLLNPKGFKDKVMFHAPEIFVDYNLGAILTGKIHIEDIRLDFDQFVVIKNKEGKLNVEALKPKKGAGKQIQKEEKKKGKTAKGKAPKIQIDHLSLKVGKVVYKDYQAGDPSVKEYNVNISEEMNDVTDIQALIGQIAGRAAAKAGLASLTGLDVNAMKEAVDVDALKGTAESLKKSIKLPFGQE